MYRWNSNETVYVDVVWTSEKKKKYKKDWDMRKSRNKSKNLITTEYALAKKRFGGVNGGVISTLGIFTLKIWILG